MNPIVKPYVLILAGGVGSRFWPASRENRPKQFLDITGTGNSLLRETVNRFSQFIALDRIFIITHKNYSAQIREAIPELMESQIILEPSRNNTAASIAYASLKLHKLDPEAICIVAPADHIIRKETELQRVLQIATDHAVRHQSLITLGIKPTRVDTGYGYIEFDEHSNEEIRKVKSFKEKPNSITAEKYVASGRYAWNAGIFVWPLNAILEAFKKYANQIHSTLHQGLSSLNTTDESLFIESAYPKTDKISVDYAILEKSDNVWTIPCDLGWSDLGTWASLYDQSTKDPSGNVQFGKPVFLENTTDSLVYSDAARLLVINGLDDYIVVDTKDCLLIFPKSDEQAIKQLKENLRKQGLDEFL